MKRGDLAMLLGVMMLAGFVLRIVPIAAQPLWSDEALTHLTTGFPPFDLLRYPLDPTAPLYFWLQGLFGGGDTSRDASRALSLLFGTLAILPAALAGREVGGKWGGLIAGAFIALSPALIDYSHEGRAYALLVFLLAVFSWLTLRAMGENRRSRDLVAIAVSGLLALYTHLIALFVVGPLMLLLGWSWLKRGRPVGWPWAALAMTLLYLPEANRLRLYQKKMHVFEWLQQPSPGDALRTLGQVWSGLPDLVGVAIAAALVLSIWRRRDDDRYKKAVVAALLAMPLFVYAAGFVAPMYMDRTILPSLLGVALAWSVTVRKDSLRAPAIAAFVVVALAGLLVSGIDRPKEQWDGAARAVARQPGILLICPRWQAAAILAALDDAERPDVLVPAVRGLTLVPAGGRWRERLFEYQFRDEWAHHRKLERYPIRMVKIEASALSLVTGQCSSEERRSIEQWFGPHRVRAIWQGRGVYAGDRIGVEQWQGVQRPRAALLAIPGKDVRRP